MANTISPTLQGKKMGSNYLFFSVSLISFLLQLFCLTNAFFIDRGVTESINNLINVYTSAAPGQKECDNAVRAIQSSRHILETANQPVTESSYYECLDIVMEKSKALGDCMTGIANHAKKSEHDEFSESVRGVSEAICGLVEAAAQSAYLVGVAEPSSVAGRRGLVDQNQFMRAYQVRSRQFFKKELHI